MKANDIIHIYLGVLKNAAVPFKMESNFFKKTPQVLTFYKNAHLKNAEHLYFKKGLSTFTTKYCTKCSAI